MPHHAGDGAAGNGMPGLSRRECHGDHESGCGEAEDDPGAHGSLLDAAAGAADSYTHGVKPLEILGEARTPDGTLITLAKQDRELLILAGGRPLMSSRMHGSEAALATFGCAALPRHDARVLVGGLGMGFTLRATLDLVPADTQVVVAELMSEIVDWNRGPLGGLANHPLKDRRVTIQVDDVGAVIRAERAGFDAILLDVDNGPDAFTATGNASLYGDTGLAAVRDALRPGGILAVWSAWEDRKFEQRLRYAGFRVKVERVRARLKQGGPRHTIFIGRAPGPSPAAGASPNDKKTRTGL